MLLDSQGANVGAKSTRTKAQRADCIERKVIKSDSRVRIRLTTARFELDDLSQDVLHLFEDYCLLTLALVSLTRLNGRVG